MSTLRVSRAITLALSLLAPAAPAAAAQETQAAAAPPDAVAPVPYFSDPAVSPDRAEIAFVSGGDIWTVPAAGGEARLLVSHPATEARPVYSPDGRRLAFTSARTGNGDIYVLTFDTGELRRVTFDDVFEILDGWSRDGRWLYFSSTSRDISGMNDVFRVASDGGTPMQVSADRYTNEFFSSVSPDNSSIAFTARGTSSGQWWRKGHSHLDEAEIWVLRGVDSAATPAAYERITEPGAKEMWPMWGADGRTIYYVSDRGGAQNVWRRAPGRAPEQVTKFTDGRVLWANASYDGKMIVFEHDFRVWKLDTASGRASEVQITRRGAPAGPAVEHLRLSDQIQDFALSPDGKKVAFVVHGEVFAASAADGGDAQRLTFTPGVESQLNWSPDNRHVAYVSSRDAVPHIFAYDLGTNTETQLTREAQDDATPRYSPDGKWLAFERESRELRVMNVATKEQRVVATATFDRPPLTGDRPFVWSPDGKWIAFMPVEARLFRNVHVVRADGGARDAARPVSFIANTNVNSISWSPDGTFILFDTGQRTETAQLARVDLIPRTPRFREDQFRDLFREESPRPTPRQPDQQRPPAPQPEPSPPATPSPSPSPSPAGAGEGDKKAVKNVEVVFDGIRRRLSLLPTGLNVNYHTISPDGKWVAMIAIAANQQNLYVYSLDELSREPAVAKQLTSTPGGKGLAHFSPDSKELFFVDQGRLSVVNLEGRVRPLAVSAEMDVDFAKEKMEVFREAWTWLRDHFYDPQFHGANWERVRAEYEPRVAGARTPDEMRRLLQLMVGELNSSHTGVGAPFSAGAGISTGRLGVRFDRTEYERNGRLRVSEVIPLGPVDLARNVKVGDYLLAVEGAPVTARTNLDELLSYKINRRVNLTVASSADGADRREVAVRPINGATEKGLLYRKWVDENRAYVERVSNGRLGYVHMFDMGEASLAQLYVDLDAANHSREGVVVDVRNNNGGFVNPYAIDVLARRGYLTMTERNRIAAPARTVLGQRALELPTILVTNQHSLSDAEDFTEGYRALKLGKVVGEPTAGWIIFTWNQAMIDGSSVRLPRAKITDNTGADMELNPRPVDVQVTRPIGETLSGRDSQLDTAVRELLQQLGAPGRR
ncbi:MAG TPA: LpqB family beta-propeller domain-containing protein [Pyrinomonadaceae bacterium]|jgi:Tol biopolymer transport system component|nr:LpqB family beta-propeller domain-containing protein [Pyrinomonadaceae bacterium]